MEKKGEKQVRIIGPPEEKICFTLTLTVNADGAKYPAIVVFKTSSKTGKIPSRVLKRYNIPENVIAMGSRSGWWTKELDDKYIHLMYLENQDASTFLLRDHAPVHTRNMAAALLKKKNVTHIFVPNCRTDEFQPLDGIQGFIRVKISCLDVIARSQANQDWKCTKSVQNAIHPLGFGSLE